MAAFNPYEQEEIVLDETSRTNPLRYIVTKTITRYDTRYSAKLVDRHDTELGHFTIKERADNKMLEMAINVDETQQGKGHARMLINILCNYLIKNYPEDLTYRLIYIDGDGSLGFWDKIGMKFNRYFDTKTNRQIEGKGYEKNISFKNLAKWAGISVSDGGRRRKSKKSVHKKFIRRIKTYRRRY